MFQQVKQASIASAMRASNVRIVDPAEPPKLPYKPSLPLNGALGLLSGLFLGVAFVVMRERADRTLQEPGETPFWLNIPELSVIPSAAREVRLSLSLRRNGTRKHKKTTTLSIFPPESRTDPPSPPTRPTPPGAAKPGVGRYGAGSCCAELITWQHKPSLIAESFRSLLTSILLCGKNGDRPRVLVLTSAGPTEGKTTVASNLAIALAEIKRKVLIIDGDLRKPRMHELFGLPTAAASAVCYATACFRPMDWARLCRRPASPAFLCCRPVPRPKVRPICSTPKTFPFCWRNSSESSTW